MEFTEYKKSFFIGSDFADTLNLYNLPEQFRKNLMNHVNVQNLLVTDSLEVLSNSGCEIFFGHRINTTYVSKMNNLRWIHLGTSGYDKLDLEYCQKRNIMVTSSSRILSESLATHVFSFMLSLMRLPHFNLIYKYSGNFSRETFDKNYANIRTLSGSKILIFGSGLSSMKLASWLSNCNCEVGIVSLSNRKVSNLPAGVIQVDVERVNNVLIEQDFVINLLSRRSDTDNYFSAERLSLLATDSFYISAGRGSTTDENALIELLNGGKIAGAALDVFSHEPLLPNSSLFQCRNLLMTPHVAAVSRDYWKLQTELFLNNLNNFASGHTMLGRVERL